MRLVRDGAAGTWRSFLWRAVVDLLRVCGREIGVDVKEGGVVETREGLARVCGRHDGRWCWQERMMGRNGELRGVGGIDGGEIG